MLSIVIAILLVAAVIYLFNRMTKANDVISESLPSDVPTEVVEVPYKIEAPVVDVEVAVDPVAMTEAEKATIAAEVEETKAELAAVKKTRKPREPRAAKTSPQQAEK